MSGDNAIAEDTTIEEAPAPADAPPADPPADPPVSDDPPSDPPADPPADDPAPKKGGAEDRIQQLVAERNATKEYADYWRERYLQDIAAGKQPPPAADEPKPAPTLADFEFDAAKWGDAYAKWAREDAAQAARAAAREEVQSASTEQAKAAARAQWNQRLGEFAKTKPDAAAVIANPALPITDAMTEVITASERGPELAYHLGTNPAEAARIARLSPAQQAAALGRIEAGLSAPAPKLKPKPKPTNAPEPPNPVGGGGAAPGINLETCSLDDYLKARLGKNRR